METRLIILLSALLVLLGRVPPASAQGTAFTYQGFLTDQGAPAHAIYDLRFTIYADASSGTIVAGPVDAGDVGVTNGLFTLRLDFGANVFNGSDRWLEIGLRPGTSTGAYTNVAPLQKITATPYAIRAAQFSGPVAASQIIGTLATSNIGVGTITSSKLASGAAVVNLNAAGQSGVPGGGLVLSATENNGALVGAGYVKIGPTTMSDTWQQRVNGTPPAVRHRHTAVWTGSEMIVWGGIGNDIIYLNDGGRYNPAANSWTLIVNTLPNTPAARFDQTAVWTGSEMIVWGGANGSAYLNTGGRYNPAGNSWTAVNTNGAPAARLAHTAVWIGSEMIVWGGDGNATYADGGRYNPAANSWTPIVNTLPNTPAARYGHTAVWTGSEMIVWGGFSNQTYYADGGRYNPAGNSWIEVNPAGVPAARSSHSAVWTGSEMIVWGGISNNFWNDGGRYDPAANRWTKVTTNGAPAARVDHTAVWTGSAMIVWGGWKGGSINDGGRYNPAGNTWTAVSTTGVPAPRYFHTAVWTGSEMIVWGGANDNSNYLNDTFSYTPSRVLYLYQRP